MKHYFLLIAFFVSLQCVSQEIKDNSPKVFYLSSQIFADTTSNGIIKRVGHNIFRKKISVKYNNGRKQFIPLDKLWGIQRKNENPTRLVNGDEYEIKFFSPIIIYAQHHFRSDRYYFSKTLDSPIFSFTAKNIKEQVDQLTLDKIEADKKIKRHLQ